MFAIIGIVIVIGAILGGYLMEKGPLLVLMQPAELLIIGGSAIGTLLIANPLPTVIKLLKGLTGVLSGSKFTQAFYLENRPSMKFSTTSNWLRASNQKSRRTYGSFR